MKIAVTFISGILVALIGSGMAFELFGQSPAAPVRHPAASTKVFHIEVQTDESWVATRTAEERKKAAREAIVAWLKAASDGDLDEVVRLSGLPFWLDGGMADSEKKLRALLTPNMGYPFTPVEFEVEEDFYQLARPHRYPMDGMLVRVSDGEKSLWMSVQFNKSVLIVGSDD